jgi:hypothetical protein
LIEEIPIFLQCCCECIDAVLQELLKYQTEFFKESSDLVYKVYQSFSTDEYATTDDISRKYLLDMEYNSMAEIASRDISILSKWRETNWTQGRLKQFPMTDTKNLIDLQGSIGAPRMLHNSGNGVSILRNTLSFTVMKPMSSIDFHVRALYPFQAEFEDELDLETDDVVKIISNQERHGSDEWWYGTSNRGTGWFPRNFVELVD